MKTAIYLRVSTQDQAENGYGLDAQRSKCRAMAEVKGWEVVQEYCDDGYSGTLDETRRPGLSAMLDAVCSGSIQAVIVSSLDRLGRSTRLVLRLVEHLGDCKAEIVSCKESLDTSTATGRFVLRMFASLAELDRESIVERTTSGRDARGRIDGERGGRIPLGYLRLKDDGITVDAEGAQVVRMIFSMRDAGSSLNAIAKRLNADGIKPLRGVQWYASSIREVLRNEDKYRGGLRGESNIRWPVILE